MNLELVMKLIYIHYWEYEMMEAFLVIMTELGTRQEAYIPYILESNPHLVFAFLNEKRLVCASNPHISFNRPLPTGRLFE
jgi:hypothetical protein